MEAEEQISSSQVPKVIGQSLPRLDSGLKVTGSAVYTRDMKQSGMLYARVGRSPFAHAKVIAIDTSAAKRLPGVKAVITGLDFPKITSEDTPPLAADEVLYFNQSVFAVAAETPFRAEEGASAVDVKYEELPAVFDIDAAMSANTPVQLHPSAKEGTPNIGAYMRIRKGDTEHMFSKDARIIENTYTTSALTHFQLEPLTFLAQPDPDGGVTIWGTSSGPHKIQAEVSKYLGIDYRLVRAKVPYMGGWFGSKEESHAAAVCARLALRAKRPVKLELSRRETMTATGRRHPSKITIKDAISPEGKIVSREIVGYFNGGAYSSLGNHLLRNSLFSASNVYSIPNLKVDTYRVYTDSVPGTAMRAPYGLQMTWAIESQMDYVAATLKLDPVKFRRDNVLAPGEKTAMGDSVESIDFKECLSLATDAIKWGHKEPGEGPWKTGKGIALAAKWAATGVSQATVRLRENGMLEVLADVVENGAGIFTGIVQIAAAELGIPTSRVVLVPYIMGAADSATSGVAGGASGSKQLVNVGKAVQLACDDLKQKVAECTRKKFGVPPSDVEFRNGKIWVKSDPSKSMEVSSLFTHTNVIPSELGEGWFALEEELVGNGTSYKKSAAFDHETGRSLGGRISPYYIPVCQAAEVAVNTETGQVKVKKIAAVMDAGHAINPDLVRGQIWGCVAMGVGAALAEEVITADGRVVNPNVADYKILGAGDSPTIDPIIVEYKYEGGPHGAKGAGEASILPTAAAIRNAIHDAVGVWLNELPMTPEKVLEALSRD